jgi:hypothetical protein
MPCKVVHVSLFSVADAIGNRYAGFACPFAGRASAGDLLKNDCWKMNSFAWKLIGFWCVEGGRSLVVGPRRPSLFRKNHF